MFPLLSVCDGMCVMSLLNKDIMMMMMMMTVLHVDNVSGVVTVETDRRRVVNWHVNCHNSSYFETLLRVSCYNADQSQWAAPM